MDVSGTRVDMRGSGKMPLIAHLSPTTTFKNHFRIYTFSKYGPPAEQAEFKTMSITKALVRADRLYEENGWKEHSATMQKVRAAGNKAKAPDEPVPPKPAASSKKARTGAGPHPSDTGDGDNEDNQAPVPIAVPSWFTKKVSETST
jgi:hypothetical protein